MMSIGATHTSTNKYLDDYDNEEDEETMLSSDDESINDSISNDCEAQEIGKLDFDEYMASAAHAMSRKSRRSMGIQLIPIC